MMLSRLSVLCAGFGVIAAAQFCPASQPSPRGWNSWDADANWVNESSIIAAAEWIRDNLLPFGFDTVTIDGGWYDNSSSPGAYNVDAYGLPIPDPARFPSAAGGQGLLPLAKRINAMGLKLGAWTIRGISTVAYESNLPIKNSPFHARDVGVLGRETNCSWDSSVIGTNAPSAAASAWYASLAQHYIDNGLQQIKIDCMFNQTWWYEDEVVAFASSFSSVAPGVEISWSPGGDGRFTPATGEFLASHAPAWGRMYRVTDDFHDVGGATTLLHHFASAAAMAPLIGVNGSYPDLDMLPFGQQNGNGAPPPAPPPAPRPNLFSPDEQRLVMTLWAITRAPLILGAVLPLAPDDNVTLPLLTNAAVLDVNAHSCHNVPTPVLPLDGNNNVTALFAWTATAADGAAVVALFNMRDAATNVSAVSGLRNGCAKDLWAGVADGRTDAATTALTREIPAHGAGIWSVSPC